jgi:hypothetical protein
VLANETLIDKAKATYPNPAADFIATVTENG